MRAIVVGKKVEPHIRRLSEAGYSAREVPGAMHLGRGVWAFPLEIEPAAGVPADPAPL